MYSFKIFYYNLVYSVDFAEKEDGDRTVMLDEYIKMQHRWFHEYYKRMVANNSSEEETRIRIQQIEQFVCAIQASFYNAFEFSSSWKDGDFTEEQMRELTYCYIDFKNMQLRMANKDFQSSFLDFATFLECIKRVASKFIETKNFNKITFKLTKESTEIQWDEFEKVEAFFKFARAFNEVRNQNYREHYSRKEQDQT